MKGILQGLTNRHIDRATAYGTEASTEKCKIMTNSRNNIIADISMNGQKLEEVMFQVPWSIPVQGWHMLIKSPHQDYLSNGCNGQTKQDLLVQHHQLWKHIQALQVSCHLHPPLWL